MLRKPETRAEYKKHRDAGNFIDLSHIPSIMEWEHFRLVENEYPYDRIASKHHMLVTKVVSEKLIDVAYIELRHVLSKLRGMYSYVMEGMLSKSVPNHWHVHLVLLKGEEYKIK